MLGRAISTVILVISQIWKPIIFIIGFALIIAFVVLWIMSIISFFYAVPFVDYIFADHKLLSFIGMTNAFVLVGIPLLSLILLVVRVVYKTRLSQNFRSGMWAFWVLNVVSLFMTGIFMSRNFNTRNHIESNLNIQVPGDTLRVYVQDSEWENAIFQLGDLYLDEERLISENVNLSILKSEDDQFHLIQHNKSSGRGSEEAKQLATAIRYQPKLEAGKINLSRYFAIPKGEQWRAQEVEFILKVPEGKAVYLGKGAGRMIHRFDVNHDVDRPHYYSDNVWLMDAKGLMCPSYIAKNNHDQDYQVADFQNVMIEGRMKVVIERGDHYSVRLKGREVYTRKVDLVQHGNSLTVTADLKRTNSPVRLYITMPYLKSLHTEYTDDVKIQGFQQASMSLKNEGTYDFKVYADVDTLSLKQIGRHEVDIRGRGKVLDVVLEKRAKLDAEHYAVDEAKIEASGNSRAKLAVAKSLIKNMQSGSRLEVDGDPDIEDKNDPDSGDDGDN